LISANTYHLEVNIYGLESNASFTDDLIVRHQFGMITDQKLEEEICRLEGTITQQSQSTTINQASFDSQSMTESHKSLRQSTFNVVRAEDIPMSNEQTAEFRREIMLFFATSSLPFKAVENKHLWSALDVVRKDVPRIGRRAISGTELNKYSDQIAYDEERMLN
jgi:hypothetical protein